MFPRIHSCLALALGAVLLGGCSEQTAMPLPVSESLTDLQTEVRQGRANVVETGRTVRNLQEARGIDIQPRFDRFIAAMDRLEQQASGVRTASETAGTTATSHFQTWERQINEIGDARLASAAKDRRTEVMETYDRLRGRLGEVRAAYRDYRASLSDIRSYLTSDLTAQGVKTMSPAMNKAIEKEPILIKQLDRLLAAIDDMTAR